MRRRDFLLGSAGFGLAALPLAADAQSPSIADRVRNIFPHRAASQVFILLDVSGSYFAEACRAAADIPGLIDALRTRDRFSAGLIQSCSFSERARILDMIMPDRESDLYAARPQVRERWQGVWNETVMRLTPTQGEGRTDIKGALLYVSQQMQAGPQGLRKLVIYSDMIEDFSQACRQPSEQGIRLRGVDVIVANMTRTSEDTRDPDAYARRTQYWQDWLSARGASNVLFASRTEVPGLLRPPTNRH